ncbi:2462_t:CDS:2, partial [Cetraspora pellucida]
MISSFILISLIFLCFLASLVTGWAAIYLFKKELKLQEEIKKYNNAKTKLDELYKDFIKLANDNENLKQQLTKEHEQYLNEAKAHAITKNSLIEANNKLNEKTQEAKNNKDNYEKTFKDLQTEILNNYKNELLLQTKDNEIKKITTQARKDYEDAKNKLKKTIKDNDKFKKKYKETFEKLLQEILNNHKNNKDEYVKKYQEMIKKLNDMNIEYQKTKEKLKSEKLRHKETKNLYKTEKEKLEKEKEAHEKTKKITQEEKKNLLKQINELIEKNKKLDNQIKDEEKKKNKLEKIVKTLEDKYNKKIGELNDLLKKKNDEIKTLKNDQK